MITKKQEQLIDGWIKELEEAGYSYDEMINIFRMARVKLQAIYSQNHKSKIHVLSEVEGLKSTIKQ